VKEYTVTWEIQVDAENARDAAREARCMQLDKDSTATVFTVKANGEREVVIDLNAPVRNVPEIQEFSDPKSRWSHWARPGKDGLRFFRDRATGKWAVADNSGTFPENTDDGIMWLDPSRGTRSVVQRGTSPLFDIALSKERDRSTGKYWTSGGPATAGFAMLVS
jgi:hypothetical protein